MSIKNNINYKYKIGDRIIVIDNHDGYFKKLDRNIGNIGTISSQYINDMYGKVYEVVFDNGDREAIFEVDMNPLKVSLKINLI